MENGTPLDAAKLKQARKMRGWTQVQAATRLGVSQGYVSLLESGRRAVPNRLVLALVRKWGLPVTAVPPRERAPLSPNRLACELGARGYEPLAYLKGRPARNPAEVLLAALRQKDLESRLVEALPWLVLRHPDMDWEWLVERAKVHDVQNRLGYVLMLASEVAERRSDVGLATRLRGVVSKLEPSRLAREDTLCCDSMTEVERKWLREARPPKAQYWNLLTDLGSAHLAYA